MSKTCRVCGVRAYSDWCFRHKPRTAIKTYKRPKQKGRRAIEYEIFRDFTARTYLDKTYGRVCAVEGCTETEALDIDHILSRGSHPQLKMDLSNLQYMCRPHHRLKTDGLL